MRLHGRVGGPADPGGKSAGGSGGWPGRTHGGGPGHAVLVARPPVSGPTRRPAAEERARLRAGQRDVIVEIIGRYNPEAVICAGPPFGHTLRNGSSRTAARSPSTAPRAALWPTSHSPANSLRSRSAPVRQRPCIHP